MGDMDQAGKSIALNADTARSEAGEKNIDTETDCIEGVESLQAHPTSGLSEKQTECKKHGKRGEEAKKTRRESRVSSDDRVELTDSDEEKSSGDEDSDDETSDTESGPVHRKKSSKKSSNPTRRRRAKIGGDVGSRSQGKPSKEDASEEVTILLRDMAIKAMHLKLDESAARDERQPGKKARSDRRMSSESSHSQFSAKGSKKAPFFRADELWNKETLRYEVKPTVEKANSTGDDAYFFTVKRKFNWEGKYRETVVEIHSKPLKDCLSEIMESCKSISLAEDSPTIHPDTLFLYLDDMRTYRRKLKAQLKSGEVKGAKSSGNHKKKKKKEMKETKVTNAKIGQLKDMLTYLDKDYAATKAALHHLIARGNITFELLWTQFRSDEVIYMPTYTAESEPRAFRVEYCTKQSSFIRGVWYEVEGKYLD